MKTQTVSEIMQSPQRFNKWCDTSRIAWSWYSWLGGRRETSKAITPDQTKTERFNARQLFTQTADKLEGK